MRNNILIFVFFLSSLSAPIFGQTKTDSTNNNASNSKNKYALGIGFGYTTGYGLSFKFKPNKFGIQTNLAPISNKDYDRFSIGFTLLYTLIESESTSLFLYQGNHYYYSIYHPSMYNNPINRKTEYFNNGIGFGIEFTFYKHLSFNLMAGYAFYENFERLSLTGETGLYYIF